ncbi:MAG: lysylphosphatidylglycerol synthase domain-containing protein [Archaeoglobaceae archaeon]|nr:lysylphosphatidylglycerol synthase domain-containing protein [Archaeoglobaceae archaeon]MDW8128822.1 lysylphosphatidylglycerol synthase domain-containing protein [Archaeoglobaceae archaeon]
MRVSIVLPAYNEAKRLRSAVEKIEEYAKNLGYDYEILIAEDGSTDGTDKIAKEIAEKNARVKHLHSDERLGRGRALMNAFKHSSGNIVVYMDVDLSTDLRHLKELVSAISEGYDVATGSRLMKESRAKRPLKRDLASKAYNFLVRFLLGSKIHDHQCGFKAFRKSVILEIGSQAKDTHWFWDTEVLVLAQKKGYKVKEIPVIWEHGGETKVRFKKDVLYMFFQIMRMLSEELAKSRKFFTFATALAIAILLFLILATGIQSFIESLSLIRLDLLALASIFYAFSFLVRGFRFRYVIKKLGEKTSTGFSSLAVSIGQTVNVITPIRLGDLARAYVFKRSGVSYTCSLGGVAVERFFDILSVAIIAFLASFYLGTNNLEPIYAIGFALLIILAIALLSRMQNFVGRIMERAKMAMNPSDGAIIFVLSCLVWLFDISVCYLLALSFGGINFFAIALAVAIGNIVKAIPITPGGIGTYELALTAIIGFYQPYSIAFTLAFVDHALKNSVTVVLGLIALSAMNLSLKEVKG